jgi:hypothetical protein
MYLSYHNQICLLLFFLCHKKRDGMEAADAFESELRNAGLDDGSKSSSSSFNKKVASSETVTINIEYI